MSKPRNRPVKRDVDRFTNIPNYVLNSEAVRTLPPAAFKVLVFMVKRCFGPKHNGQIAFGSRFGCSILNIAIGRYEEKTIGLSPGTTARAIQELQKRGLVRCTKGSSFKMNKRTVREYELAWLDAGEAPKTNEFLYWKPIKKQKGRLTSDTIRTPTVSPMRQPQRPNGQKRPLQCHPRHYARSHSVTSETRNNQCIEDVPQGLSSLLEAVRGETDAILTPEKQFGPLANGFPAQETIQ